MGNEKLNIVYRWKNTDDAIRKSESGAENFTEIGERERRTCVEFTEI